jgi:hypothetical protein
VLPSCFRTCAFHASSRKADFDETMEGLLELLGRLAVERGRRVVMIFDEFQEIVEIDRHLPRLLRAVFQAQPEVGHVYLGSRRHLVDAIFNDENESFWRSVVEPFVAEWLQRDERPPLGAQLEL